MPVGDHWDEWETNESRERGARETAREAAVARVQAHLGRLQRLPDVDSLRLCEARVHDGAMMSLCAL